MGLPRYSNHRRLKLVAPWAHEGAVEVSSFVPVPNEEAPELHGRTWVTFSGSSFSLGLRATPAELRALAALLVQTADDAEGVEVGEKAAA